MATSCVSIISTSCSNVCSNATRSPATFRVSEAVPRTGAEPRTREPIRAWCAGPSAPPRADSATHVGCDGQERPSAPPHVPRHPPDGRHVAAPPPRLPSGVGSRPPARRAPSRTSSATTHRVRSAEGARHVPCRAEMPRFRHLGGPPRRHLGAPPPDAPHAPATPTPATRGTQPSRGHSRPPLEGHHDHFLPHAPLGVTLVDGGANVALFSSTAERVEFCRFDEDGTEHRTELRNRTPGTPSTTWSPT